MRFVICLDEPESARWMLEAVEDLVAAAHADVDLLYVVDDESPSLGEARSDRDDLAIVEQETSGPRARGQRHLEQIASEFEPHPHPVVLATADPVSTITRYTARAGADVVVFEEGDKARVKEGRIGDAAHEISREGVAPILLVKVPEETHVDVAAIPPGVPVFTSEGTNVGHVAETRGDSFSVSTPRGVIWLRGAAAAEINGGHLTLGMREEKFSVLVARRLGTSPSDS